MNKIIDDLMISRELKWDIRFMKQAKSWALECSKDPSTKCCAIFVKDINKQISMGYNGLPSNIQDYAQRLEDRDVKYKLTLHAEENAHIFAEGRSLRGATIYTWPFQSCAHCAALLVQIGIHRAVSIAPSADILSRWGKDIHLAQEIFHEASVRLKLLNEEMVGVDNWQAICNNVPSSDTEEGKS